MSVWGRIYKECQGIGAYIVPGSSHTMTDEEYKEMVACIVEEKPVNARYHKLMRATCQRLSDIGPMTVSELEQKLVMNIIKISRLYGRRWMNPVRCFSRGGVLEALNQQIDDGLSKVCGTKDTIPFEVLMDILSYLVLHKTVSTWKEDKFIRDMRISTCLYYSYLAASALLLALMIWCFVLVTFICRDSRAFIGLSLIAILYIMIKTIYIKVNRRRTT
jgi:hypothetical protein